MNTVQWLRQWRWVTGGGLIVAGIVVAALYVAAPGDWPAGEIVGVDTWKFHKPFAGSAVISQKFTADSEPLSRIDILIVDFAKKSNRSPIDFQLFAEGESEPLRTAQADGRHVRDDYYLPFSFEAVEYAAGRAFVFSISSPQAELSGPYAVRLTESRQDIAFRYYRQTTNGYLLYRWALDHKQPLIALAAVTILAGLAIWLIPRAAKGKRIYVRVLLAAVLIVAILFQWQIARLLQGDPGGDAYYYVNAAEQITQGINPLSVKSFRLPGYPLLLVPAISPDIPDILWGRLVGMAATVGIIGSLVMLAESLRFRRYVGIAAAVLLFFNADFVVTSVRPRPYVVFTFLLLLSTALFFRVRTMRGAFFWGVLLGIAGMTRQEMYVPAAILGIAFFISLLYQRRPRGEVIRRTLAAALPLFVIISPYFYYNYKHLGNPFASSYFDHPEVQVPASLNSFITNNLKNAREVLTSVWLPSSSKGMREGAGRQFAGIFAVFLLIYLAQRQAAVRQRIVSLFGRWSSGTALAGIVAAAIAVIIFRWLFRGGESWGQELNMIAVSAMIIGAVDIVRVGRWRGVVVLAVLVSQLLIATVWQPAPKHYQQSYPLLALAMAAALTAASGLPNTRQQRAPAKSWKYSLLASPLVLGLALFGAPSIMTIDNLVDELNYSAAPYYVTIAAAEELQQYEGKALAEVQYEDNNAFRFHSYLQYPFEKYEGDPLPLPEQLKMLCEKDIRYLVDNNGLDFITLHKNPIYAGHFRFLFEKKALSRNNYPFQVIVWEFAGEKACSS